MSKSNSKYAWMSRFRMPPISTHGIDRKVNFSSGETLEAASPMILISLNQ
jgi:hypothetical protein